MLLEMAIADAYGIAFEFVEHTPDRPNDLSRYYQNPKYPNLKPGQYTDDTQRAFANACVMFSKQEFNAEAYAETYLSVLRRSPRDGYSRGYQNFLENTPDSRTFIKTINRTKASNGAIMGVAPLGYLRTPGEVRMAATIQAITTHSPETIPFACAIALSAHYFIHKIGPKDALHIYLDVEVDWTGADTTVSKRFLHQRTKMTAVDTYYAVMRALHTYDNLADIIRWSVECGGDTDSAAAIAVAIASCSDEYKNNIPQALIDGLENGEFGKDFLHSSDLLLKSKFCD